MLISQFNLFNPLIWYFLIDNCASSDIRSSEFCTMIQLTKCLVSDVVFRDTKVAVNGGGSGLTSSADRRTVCRFPHGYAWKFLMTLTASRHSGVIKMSTTMCSSLLDLYDYILTSDGHEHLASRFEYWSITFKWNQEDLRIIYNIILN